ncbi:MAG: hypothetical protein K9W42_10320 [Candidatus Heimdallarchaeota archaeon]|nr:hypothetical protein [Candidatus Heimdallarchaeota archaeon]
MANKRVIVSVFILGIILIGGLILGLVLHYYFAPLKHETPRWAVIKDTNGDKIAIETPNDIVWEQLTQLFENGSRMFIGSLVERYDNSWGFRFRPANLTVAPITAEGLQATLQYIKNNLDYWLGGWAYTLARVVAIHVN